MSSHPNEPSLKELLKIQKEYTLTEPQRNALNAQIKRHRAAETEKS